MKTKLICIPIHPDDKEVPVSRVHLPLGHGRYAIIECPLGRKTLTALIGTLRVCHDSLVTRTEDEWSI